MTERIIKPIPMTKENFSKFGDMISTENIKPIEINNGYANRFDDIAKIDTANNNGETTISIFSALKRSFPMKIDMMEKHPLGTQAFIPMKETTFLTLVAPEGKKLEMDKIESFVVPKGKGVNYKTGIWHFPLISLDNAKYITVDKKDAKTNIEIYNFDESEIFELNYE